MEKGPVNVEQAANKDAQVGALVDLFSRFFTKNNIETDEYIRANLSSSGSLSHEALHMVRS